MNKKGFTLVELLSVIVVLAIISGLAVVGVSHVVKRGKDSVYNSNIATLRTSAYNYLIDNIDTINQNTINTTGLKITFNTFVSNGYIMENDFKDPNGGNCDNSYVIVNKGSTSKYNYQYKVCLICSKDGNTTYKSADCPE